MAKSRLAAAGRETRAHIGIYGRCNSGKSSLLNSILGTDHAIVSPSGGTTTDVVRKSYEIVDFAPVVFIETAGVDDLSPLGVQRVERTLETINQIDMALLLFTQWGEVEQDLAERFNSQAVPYLPVYNRVAGAVYDGAIIGVVEVDAKSCSPQEHVELMDAIKVVLPEKAYTIPSMFGGRMLRERVVVLVCPIDGGAPAGRLILPQVQALRELLDMGALPIAVQPGQLEHALQLGEEPVLVVTDSQVFAQIRAQVPSHIEVTSFSILLAAAKGDHDLYIKGLAVIDALRDGDRVLIGESCSHQVSCDDIGRVKIPRWLEQYTGYKLEFTVVSGLAALPKDISSYALMVQCGGCMVTRSQLRNRIRFAAAHGVAVTNYGMLIRKITASKKD